MKKLKDKVKKYFKDPNNPIIEELPKQDLEYIVDYMNSKPSMNKIFRIESDSKKLEIFQEDNDGIAYIRTL